TAQGSPAPPPSTGEWRIAVQASLGMAGSEIQIGVVPIVRPETILGRPRQLGRLGEHYYRQAQQ
ncbi:MAG: hypothetical protein NT154_16445, partial [Verrucomicrobia bacterium]|nr:hypothetical protein [Verrucomicrobiota bacterium]